MMFKKLNQIILNFYTFHSTVVHQHIFYLYVLDVMYRHVAWCFPLCAYRCLGFKQFLGVFVSKLDIAHCEIHIVQQFMFSKSSDFLVWLKEHLCCGNMEENIEIVTGLSCFWTFFNLIDLPVFSVAQGALE